MADGSAVEADDERAKVRALKPERHHSPEHAAPLSGSAALARDDKHELHAARLRGMEEALECVVGFPLGQPVEVEASPDLRAAACKDGRKPRETSVTASITVENSSSRAYWR